VGQKIKRNICQVLRSGFRAKRGAVSDPKRYQKSQCHTVHTGFEKVKCDAQSRQRGLQASKSLASTSIEMAALQSFRAKQALPKPKAKLKQTTGTKLYMAKFKLRYVNSFKDRHGRLRHQCRIPGQKSFGLPGLPGSAEFMEAYQAALAAASLASREIGARRTKAGTINAAIVGYYASKSFTDGLASETQRMRRNILERFRVTRAPSGQTYGDKSIATIERRHILKLLEALKPYAQKNWLKTIRGLMAFAVANSMRKEDPSESVKAIKTGKSVGHMTWLEPQIAMYREHHKIGTAARLALELLLNVAARRHDAHTLGQQHIRDGKLCWRPHKTLRTTNKMLKVPILPEFQEALDAMPANDSLTFLVNDYGRPFASSAAFGNKFADWCTAAGLKPVICDDGRVRSFRAHGLRKAALTRAAHAGCTGTELMALSGHATLAQLQVYLDEVDQERQADAAMAKIKAKTETPTYKPSTPRLQIGS
jgi:integrase/recombinase XerD